MFVKIFAEKCMGHLVSWHHLLRTLPGNNIFLRICNVGRIFLSNISILFCNVINSCQHFMPGSLWDHLVRWHHLFLTLPANDIFPCISFHEIVECLIAVSYATFTKLFQLVINFCETICCAIAN